MPTQIPGAGVRIFSTFRAQNFPEIKFADGRTLVPQTDGGSATTASFRGLGSSIGKAISSLTGKDEQLTPLQQKELELRERKLDLEEKRVGIAESDVNSKISSRSADNQMKQQEASLRKQASSLQKQKFDLQQKIANSQDANEKKKLQQEAKKIQLAERRLQKEIDAFQNSMKSLGSHKVGDVIETPAGKREVSSVNKDGTVRSLKALPTAEIEAEQDAKARKDKKVTNLEQDIADLAAKEGELEGLIEKGGDQFGPDGFLNPLPSRGVKLKETKAKKSSLEAALERELSGEKTKSKTSSKSMKLPAAKQFKEGTVIRKDGKAWRLVNGQWEQISG